jgi:O-antigen/teichoic acid export membrane protein
MGFALSGMPVLVLIVSSFWFYSGSYRNLRPSVRFIDLGKVSDLIGLGFKFFILSLSGVIVFSTNNVIISQLFGPTEVAIYNVAFKYFSVLLMGFSIVVNPFWSAFTDAWTQGDLNWIKSTITKLKVAWLLFSSIGLFMLVFSPWVYEFWVGPDLTVSYSISGLVLLWFIIRSWNNIFVQFLNGVGIVKIQIYIGIFSALINIPLAVFFAKKIGVQGVFLSNVIVASVGVLVYPIQCKMLLNGNAKGAFNE